MNRNTDHALHPQSQAAILAYLQKWGILASMDYHELTFEHIRMHQFAVLRHYLQDHGMAVLIRGFWDDTYHQGQVYFIYDTTRFSFQSGVRACEQLLFSRHGYDIWTPADEQQAAVIRQRKVVQRAKRLAIKAHQITKHK